MALESHFLADVHLPLIPGPRTELLLDYLRSCHPASVRQVFFLGDLFHYWIPESRQIREAYGGILEEIGKAAGRGVGFHFFSGNRDFLFAHSAARRLGDAIEVHQERLLLDLGPRRAYVSHGDELCVRDWGYRVWRKFARSAPTYEFFHRLPESWRDRLVKALSGVSRGFTASKSVTIPVSVYARIFCEGAAVIIHGHVHRSHHIGPPEVAGEIWMLGSWDETPSLLAYEHGTDRFELRGLPHNPAEGPV